MKRPRTLPDAPPHSDLFGEPETQPEASQCSHTRRESASRKVLERMGQAFRALESFRTLAWMGIESGKRQEVLKILREWEQAVSVTRDDYERLTS